MLTKEAFAQMNEAALREEVIMPLLTAMGYKDVFHWHGGSGEQGKDVVCWKPRDLDKRENLAIVAKAVKTSGQAKLDKGSAAEIQMQISQCFGASYNAPGSLEKQWVHRVWIMSNHEISKETQNSVNSSLGENSMVVRNVEFIHGDKLWKMVEQYLPVSILQYAQKLQEQIETADSNFTHRVTVGNDSIHITLEEKNHGTAERKPLTLKGQLVFPTKADKAKFDKAFKRHLETGEALDVPAQYIGKIDLPQAFKSILGTESFHPQGMRLQPTFTSKQLPVQITFRCEDGDNFVSHFVRLEVVRAGTKELMLVGNQKDAPYDIEIVMRYSDKQTNIATSPWTSPYNAVQWLSFLKMRTCLSKPVSIEFFALDLGIKVFDMTSQGDNQGPPPEHVDLIEKLASLQKKFMTPFVIPDRDFTDEEVQTIEDLYDGVTTGRSEAEWLAFKQTIRPTKEDLDTIIEVFGGDHLGFISIDSNKIVELLGVRVPVGPVREIAHNAKLGNIEELRNKYNELLTAEKFELDFTPADGAVLSTEYMQWLPKAENENIEDQSKNIYAKVK